MKKVSILVIISILVLSLVACSSSKLADNYDQDKVIEQGQNIVKLINELNYQGINNATRDDLKDALSVEVLESAFKEPIEKAGKFVEYKSTNVLGQKSKSTDEEYAVVVMECKYENNNLTYTISFDKNYEIVGLYIK